MEQFTFGEKDNYLSHCDKRWRERISKGSERLLTLVEILNQNVPHDWRLTRFGTEFLVEDYQTGATLCGHQYRTLENELVYKEIETVLGHGSTSREKLKRNYSPPKAGRPNLVIDKEEVWARQYERTATPKLKESSPQYFRMHRLTKEGLSAEHKWLKWSNTTRPEWTAEEDIPNNYHGEDYWQLPVYRSTTR